MPKTFAGLKAREHGYYERHPEERREAVQTLYVATDRGSFPYELVKGVAIAILPRPNIVALRKSPEHLHVVFTLITGQRACSFDRELIKELWMLGSPVVVHTTITKAIQERLQTRDAGSPLGWPAVYEITD